MPHFRIAAILTCHNRREKTVACLRALRAQVLQGWNLGQVESRESNDENQSPPPATRHSPLAAASPTTLDPRHSTPNSTVSAFNFQLCSADAPVASPATPFCSPDNDKALPRGCSAFSIDVFLTDDGCTDGTADAARAVWPGATIIQGDGGLFWCGGMRVAWMEAAKADPDYYLLLNDDTILYPNALEQLLNVCPDPSLETVSVGAICDPITREWSYGGLQSDHEFPMQDGQPRPCRTMNANCTLIPRAVYDRLGMFHHAFRHAMGDMDYGLAVTRAGITILETTDIVGACSRNSVHGTWKDCKLSRTERLRKLVSVKGLPPSDWFVYCRRNCGQEWIRYFLSPYMRVLVNK